MKDNFKRRIEALEKLVPQEQDYKKIYYTLWDIEQSIESDELTLEERREKFEEELGTEEEFVQEQREKYASSRWS
ncbi:MAG: hypothetical protein A4E66_00481 [Syntrophus sp. PtaB.Bin001]|nr:MAG: hypothetical protein A4E66_00481 [Syntrophus sp. PtaB.Bin001]